MNLIFSQAALTHRPLPSSLSSSFLFLDRWVHGNRSKKSREEGGKHLCTARGEGRKEAHLQYVGKEGRQEEGAYPACSRTKEVLDEEEREGYARPGIAAGQTLLHSLLLHVTIFPPKRGGKLTPSLLQGNSR